MLKYFYGVMGASKSAHALMTYYDCKAIADEKITTFLLKPSTDTRASWQTQTQTQTQTAATPSAPISSRNDLAYGEVSSRTGLYATCVLFSPVDSLDTVLYYLLTTPTAAGWLDRLIRCRIIVDEAQFCTPAQVDELRALSDLGATVYCYGLKNTFKNELFPGSKRLVELADEITEIPHLCRCGQKAIYNLRIVTNKTTGTRRVLTTGEDIQISDPDSANTTADTDSYTITYESLCPDCASSLRQVQTPDEEALY